MKFTLELVETPAHFRYEVLNATCGYLNPIIFTKVNKLKGELAKRLKVIIENSREVQLLLHDSHLIGDFGFPQGDARPYIDAIINKICESIYVKFNPFIVSGGKITGGIEIGAIFSDFSDILQLPEAYITYYSRRFKLMVSLDWLAWLIQKGNRIIIRDFHIEYGTYGRSGEATMKMSGTWRVDPRVSGTQKNNFLTRALDDRSKVSQELESAIEDFFRGIL